MREVEQELLALTGATSVVRTESVQNLWSGYGDILRYHLAGGDCPSVILKHIRWPEVPNHPRGWDTHLSHQRKQKSYEVEQHWYEAYAARTTSGCRVPELLRSINKDGETFLLLEDLNASGYPLRFTPDTVTMTEIKSGLRWLAHFHAAFMGEKGEGLWPVGTYWHLNTRPDEWARMQNQPLKDAARQIDKRLSASRFQTLVHGDAKLANFCFGKGGEVAAVDFQYVGRGCGMKDVAYFISSCLEEEDCQQHEEALLGEYFSHLQAALGPETDFAALHAEWNDLYRYAWADFYRFLDGWSPGHWKMHDYSEALTRQVLQELKKTESQ